MPLWIPVTLAAASFQTVRFMLQKVLSSVTLSAAGATFSRFVYSAPLILLLLWAYVAATGAELPALSAQFWGFATIGGLSQILATVCVVALFKERNFAVGITFKKTEVIQTAISTTQNVGWRSNTYQGTWTFVVAAVDKTESVAEWQGGPDPRDQGSTFTPDTAARC